MTTSVVDICNSALIHLGAEFISSLGENNNRARACNQFYENSRDAVLTQGHWNFAIKQQQLSKLVGTPLFGHDFIYQLPADCLKPLIIEDDHLDLDWKVKGDKIYTDIDGLKLEYIYRNTSVDQYTPLFVVALEFFLAHRMAYMITGSRAIASDMKELYDDALADAQDVDAQVGRADDLDSDSLITARG